MILIANFVCKIILKYILLILLEITCHPLLDKFPAIISDFMVIERNSTYLLIVGDFYSLELSELLNHSITAWENEGNV